MKVSSPDIQEELDRVLQSRCFRTRKAAQKFLSYIVQQTVDGQGKDINQHSIATEGLGKETDFDPSSNPLIRVQAGRLRKQLEEYYAGEGRENMFRIMLPVGSYQPAFLNRDDHQKFNVFAGRPRSPGTSQGPGLICVPRIFTQDRTTAWSIITRLTRDYVINLTHFNCCQILFADENKSTSQIWPDSAWSEYEADFAFLFDLHDDDEGYNLKCSLAHSQTREIVWAKNYTLDRSYPSPERLQHIFREMSHNTINLERGIAHDAWARHLLDTKNPIQPQHHIMLALRQCIWDMTPESLEEAQQLCKQRMISFPRDVQNLAAYATLFRINFLVKTDKFDSSKETRNQLGAKLMSLAPGNASTHMFQAFLYLMDDQIDACIDSTNKAMEINPLDIQMQATAGLILTAVGEWDKGVRLIESSADNITICPDWYHMPIAVNFYRLGQYEQALKAAENIRTPTFWATALRTVLYQKQGLEQQATQARTKLVELYPDFSTKPPAYIDHLPSPVKMVIYQLWEELVQSKARL